MQVVWSAFFDPIEVEVKDGGTAASGRHLQ